MRWQPHKLTLGAHRRSRSVFGLYLPCHLTRKWQVLHHIMLTPMQRRRRISGGHSLMCAHPFLHQPNYPHVRITNKRMRFSPSNLGPAAPTLACLPSRSFFLLLAHLWKSERLQAAPTSSPLIIVANQRHTHTHRQLDVCDSVFIIALRKAALIDPQWATLRLFALMCVFEWWLAPKGQDGTWAARV